MTDSYHSGLTLIPATRRAIGQYLLGALESDRNSSVLVCESGRNHIVPRSQTDGNEFATLLDEATFPLSMRGTCCCGNVGATRILTRRYFLSHKQTFLGMNDRGADFYRLSSRMAPRT